MTDLDPTDPATATTGASLVAPTSPVPAAEFRRRTTKTSAIRAGIVLGVATLVVAGAAVTMGASPTGSPAASAAATDDPARGTMTEPGPAGHGMRGDWGGPGFGLRGGFGAITITAIDGNELDLETEDGWTRTITVTDETTISEAGQEIALGDLEVGDEIRFRQTRTDAGEFEIEAIAVVAPMIGGTVTAVGTDTITVTSRDGQSRTIHVDADTVFRVHDVADAGLDDIAIDMHVIAAGTLRSDGSLDAGIVHAGLHLRGGGHGPHGAPDAMPEPSATTG